MRDSYKFVSGIIFGLVAIVQAVRVVNQWPVQVGPFAIPIWFSLVAVAFAAGLCIWAFASRR